MKKSFLIIAIFLIALSVAVGTASAASNRINIKGDVTGISGDTLTVSTKKGTTYDIVVPEGIDISEIEVGDPVVVKATLGEDDTWQAQVVKEVGSGKDKEEEEDIDPDDLEGFKDHAAFCADDKKEEPHPVALLIAARYSVSETFVMDYYCEGYSMGAIMLALRTSQMEGVSTDPDEILLGRADGDGWGKIWQEMGLIGSEKEGHSPPGQLKKP